ncbi:MAG: prolyl oligopeptidase family serine peptidase [Oligoflexia bacterium]|nr:prolyl oligopeptidase family serine peptidase [Oligoflexia bacterium]MBF0367293.1 prolyl oligopeptidase family serine peptidase [Oligoflexia bacterium]
MRHLKPHLLPTLILLLAYSFVNAHFALATEKRKWYQFGFKDPIYNEVVLHYLGQAWHQSSDVGEVLETASRIDESDPSSWTREWRKSAERLATLAKESEQANHPLSAAQAYLRAATYLRAALHHQIDPYSVEVRELAEREVLYFKKFLILSQSPCRAVQIPYEGTTLPGYFCKSSAAKKAAPVLLFQEGRDGWAEDGRFIADEAMKRGIHVLMFDGPGIGQVIRLQGLAFRPDWDKVITPVIDYTISLAEVDPSRIALMAVSMGGFLGPAAATKEHRLKVLIANPGVLDWSSNMETALNQIDNTLLSLLDKNEEEFNTKMNKYMQVNSFLRWGVIDFMWHHGVKTPAALIKELRKYRLGANIHDITAYTLVVDAEAEKYGRSKEFFEALITRKDYLMFTEAETAQFHVQPGASAIATHHLLDWIEQAL